MFFESDCLRFIKASVSLDPSSSEVSLVVHDIRIFWHAQPGWQLRFDYRETKMVAHELAKLACTISQDQIWMESVPANVENFVTNDKLVMIVKVE